MVYGLVLEPAEMPIAGIAQTCHVAQDVSGYSPDWVVDTHTALSSLTGLLILCLRVGSLASGLHLSKHDLP